MALRRPTPAQVAIGAITLGLFPVAGNVLAAQVPELDSPVSVTVAVALYVVMLALLLTQTQRTPDTDGHPDLSAQIARAQCLGWRAEARSLRLLGEHRIRVPWTHAIPLGTSRKLAEDVRSRRWNQPAELLSHVLAVAEPPSVVLLGAGGAGKSATLLVSAIQLAEHATHPKFPVLIPLSSWNGRSDSIEALAAQVIVDSFPALAGSEQARSIVRQQYAEGALVLLVDGLDELAPRSQAHIVERLRRYGAPFVVTGRPTVADDDTVAGLLGDYIHISVQDADLTEVFVYLADVAGARHRARIQQIHDAGARGDDRATHLTEALRQPLTLAAFARTLELADTATVEDILTSTTITSVASARSEILQALVVQAAEESGTPDARGFGVRILAVLNDQDRPTLWWTLGDLAPLLYRIAAGLVIGTVLGCAVMPFAPVLGGSLGATFLTLRTIRGGRLPIGWHPKALLRTPWHLVLAASIGALVSVSVVNLVLAPQATEVLVRLLAGQIQQPPAWAQLVAGVTLPLLHILHSGRVLAGYRARVELSDLSPAKFFVRALAGAGIFGITGAVFLTAEAALLLAVVGGTVGASMAMTEGVVNDLDAPSPHASFAINARSEIKEATTFTLIFGVCLLITLVPALPIGPAFGYALLLATAVGFANSVGGSALGRWILLTLPYVVLLRKGPARYWTFVASLHGVGIVRYIGSSYALRHADLLPATQRVAGIGTHDEPTPGAPDRLRR